MTVFGRDEEDAPPDVAIRDRARIGVRLTAGFVVRTLTTFAKIHEGEITTALIFLAMAQANNINIDRNQSQPPRYMSLSDPPPDSERRPVSVLALSRVLSLPVETTRRHVNRLIERGFCSRVKGGVVVTLMPVGPEHESGVIEIYVLLKRFIRQLEWAGICPTE